MSNKEYFRLNLLVESNGGEHEPAANMRELITLDGHIASLRYLPGMLEIRFHRYVAKTLSKLLAC